MGAYSKGGLISQNCFIPGGLIERGPIWNWGLIRSFTVVKQSRCCSNCEKFPDSEADKVPIQKKRLLDELKLEQLRKEVENIIFEMKLKHVKCMEYFQAVDIDIVNDILENVEFIYCENDLLFRYGIWNEDSSSQLFSVICKYAPQISS